MKRFLHEIECLRWIFKPRIVKRIKASADLCCSAIAELGEQDMDDPNLLLPKYAATKGVTVEHLIQSRLAELNEMHKVSPITNILVAIFVILLVGGFLVTFLRIAQLD